MNGTSVIERQRLDLIKTLDMNKAGRKTFNPLRQALTKLAADLRFVKAPEVRTDPLGARVDLQRL